MMDFVKNFTRWTFNVLSHIWVKISLLTKHGNIFVSEPKQTGKGLKYAKI